MVGWVGEGNINTETSKVIQRTSVLYQKFQGMKALRQLKNFSVQKQKHYIVVIYVLAKYMEIGKSINKKDSSRI